METGALTGERGQYRLIQPIGTIQIPPTVQVMLAARIDRLPERAARAELCATVRDGFADLSIPSEWPMLGVSSSHFTK